MILHIESATDVCAVSVAVKGKLIHEIVATEQRDHARLITVKTDQLLAEAGYIYSQIDAVAVSSGPGSYTGLRIGVATAKGFCFALDRPLIAVETLLSMAGCMLSQSGDEFGDNTILVPMIDARRLEVYTAAFDTKLNRVGETKASILTPESFLEWKGNKLILFGDGAAKFQPMAGREPEMTFPSDFRLTTAGMTVPAFEKYRKKEFADRAYFEPCYLKDFAGRPSF